MHEVGMRGWPLVKGHILGGSWDPGLLGQILERWAQSLWIAPATSPASSS